MSSHEPPSKKRKLAKDNSPQASLASLKRAITPPPRSSTGTPADEHDISLPLRSNVDQNQTQVRGGGSATEDESEMDDESVAADQKPTIASPKVVRFLPTPVQLTRIRDLPASSNIDTVGLDDLLGDPLIKELWNFNYLFDVDLVM
jgi:hypothetical protein